MAERSAPAAGEPRPPLSKRLTPSEWEAIDVVVAVVLAGIAIPVFTKLRHEVSAQLPLWAETVVSLAATLPLAVRRRWPLSVLAVVGTAVTFAGGFGLTFGPNVMIALAIYTVATRYDRRTSASALVVTEVALVTALVVAELTVSKGDTVSPVVAAAGWFVGDAVRARRAYAAGLAEQAAQRQRDEVERARRSVVEERVLIARELHDVLAHSLSVIAIQAGVGRHVLESQPEETRQALAAVETTSRSALDELRRVVGLLRQSDEPSSGLAPAPGLGDLAQLVEQVGAAGVPVELDLRGQPASLPPGVELSLYRIVQEALTNVVKHAGPASAKVCIAFEQRAVEIAVIDNGRGPSPAAAGSGAGNDHVARLSSSADEGTSSELVHHGIIGMQERVALFGGSLTAGPDPRGGFRVTAHLPLDSVGGES